ncbi:MAG: hypothetical protein R2825_17385 [Saprospiraceae bacterium]
MTLLFQTTRSFSRCHGRDAAIYLAHLHEAKVPLWYGNALMESFKTPKMKEYGLMEMPERFRGIELPQMVITDMKQETKERKMQAISPAS